MSDPATRKTGSETINSGQQSSSAASGSGAAAKAGEVSGQGDLSRQKKVSSPFTDSQSPAINRNIVTDMQRPAYRIQLLKYQMRNTQSIRLVWDRLLTNEERLTLSNDFKAAADQFRHPVSLLNHFRKMSEDRAAVVIAHRIDLLSQADHDWLLRSLAEHDMSAPASRRMGTAISSKPELDKIMKDVRTRKLVVLEGQGVRLLFWNGQPIPTSWSRYKTAWDLIKALAHGAQGAEPVDANSLDGETTSNTIAHRLSRLKKRLPRELGLLIRCVDRAYRLELDPRDVRVIHANVTEWDLENHGLAKIH